jgi:methylmalonyl-CoA/ethylmalonyl-CoA epimerase
MRILGIHHVTLAVRDLDAAAATFEALFGARPGARRPVPAFGTRVADVRLGDGTVELAAPLAPDNPLRRFLERKGEGFYTLALEVDDIQGAARELAARGVRVSEPVESEPGVYSSFVAMSATHGLSIQLVQLAADGPLTPPAHNAIDADSAPPPIPLPSSDNPAAGQDFRRPDADAPSSPDAMPAVPAPPLDLTPDEWYDVD